MDERKNMSIAVKGGGPDMIAEEAEAEASSVLAWTGREDSQWRAVKVKGAGRGGGGRREGTCGDGERLEQAFRAQLWTQYAKQWRKRLRRGEYGVPASPGEAATEGSEGKWSFGKGGGHETREVRRRLVLKKQGFSGGGGVNWAP